MRLLIVDDEPPARAALAQLCRDYDDIEVVGEAASGRAAIGAVQRLCPDVLLLDIGLPDMSGFDVLRVIRDERGPLAIIVTAHSEHAVSAFDIGAVDYLLKPIDVGRFRRSVGRAKARLEGQTVSSASGANGLGSPCLIGEKDRRLYPLHPRNIDFIESDGNYVNFRTTNADYISRDSIKRLTAILSHMGFVRIERSLLLNLHAVEFVEPAGHGTYAFTLTSGTVLQSSATYRDEILHAMPLMRTVKSTRPVEPEAPEG
jgi:DNA-binding LytR/AlgR family response regulator